MDELINKEKMEGYLGTNEGYMNAPALRGQWSVDEPIDFDGDCNGWGRGRNGGVQ